MQASSQKTESTPFAILHERQHAHISSVKEDQAYNYYGSYKLAQIVDEASNVLVENTDLSLDNAKSLLNDFISVSVTDHLKDKEERWGDKFDKSTLACWLTVRMTKPTEAYTDKPRWHQDGRMFDVDNTNDAHNKYAMTLLGNPTLALEDTASLRALLPRLDDSTPEDIIKIFAKESRVAIQPTDIIRFSWGHDDSPVHSEPDMSTDRVFISVLFASEREMRSMCEWRNVTFRE